jgi:hypothetical protein
MAGASDTIWQAIQARLEGGSRFTPGVMDDLLGGVRSQAEGAAGRAAAESAAAMQRRGLSRSTIAGSEQRQIRTSLYGNVLQADVELKKAKITADFQDKTQAINDGMNWLNSLRSYVSSMTATAAQREVAMANIQLGYQQLQHATDMMREGFAQDMARIGVSI